VYALIVLTVAAITMTALITTTILTEQEKMHLSPLILRGLVDDQHAGVLPVLLRSPEQGPRTVASSTGAL
jgi:hypothetical protein